MTHARYSSSDNTLKEISQMEKPVKPKMGLAKSSFDGAMERYTKQLAAYEKHVASLRTLPCHPSCKTVWKEGDVLTEGKDYEVKECRTWTKREDYGWGCSECCNKDAGCDEDCDSNYYRPNCPFCKGKGWFKEQPLFAYPTGK